MKNLRYILISSILMISALYTTACPVCDRRQPKVLGGLSHGTGAQSRFDYIIVGCAVIIVLLTLYFSLRMLIKPGEHAQEHIKRLIINEQLS